MAYLINIEDGIAKFTIEREQRRNAVNTEVVDGLEKFISVVEEDEEIQFAVITGAGNAFCSGGDLIEYHSLKTEEEALPMLKRMANQLYRLQTLAVPVIALVNGTAVGGGCEIATACDYRIVHTEVKAGFIQGTLAITTGWGGGTLWMEKSARYDTALQLFTEAKIHPATYLKEIGWATTLYEGKSEEALGQFIKEMKKIHPFVHRAYKEISIRKWRANLLHERMMEEVKLCAKLWGEDAHHEAVEQFLNKKK